jgi:hypothetical protein
LFPAISPPIGKNERNGVVAIVFGGTGFVLPKKNQTPVPRVASSVIKIRMRFMTVLYYIYLQVPL